MFGLVVEVGGTFFLAVLSNKGLHAVCTVIVDYLVCDDECQLGFVLDLCHESDIDEYHALGCGEGVDVGTGDGIEAQFGAQVGVVAQECVGNPVGKV